MDIIREAEEVGSVIVKKLEQVWSGDVVPAFEAAEKEAILIFKPIWAQLEANAVTDLAAFVQAVIAGAKGKSAQEILEVVLSELKIVGGELLKSAEKLGENGLLSLVAALLAKLAPAAVAAVA